jgi:hypothetical protein
MVATIGSSTYAGGREIKGITFLLKKEIAPCTFEN